MRSTFTGLNIGASGLRMAQINLDLTGHNIANAETIGYTRQRMNTAAIPPASLVQLLASDKRSLTGKGVEPLYIEQIRNPFLDMQYRKENAATQYLNSKEQHYGEIEGLFNTELDKIDQNTNISSVFTSFYKSLYSLTENPADLSIRKNLVENAAKMVDSFNDYAKRLIEKQADMNGCVKTNVGQINDIAESIAQLNEKIYSYELYGAKANDLRDQRNVLLDQLSGIVDMKYYEDLGGKLVVEIDGGTLVNHNNFNKLMTVDNEPNPIAGGPMLSNVYWQDSAGNPTYKVNPKSGEIKSYMDLCVGNSDDNKGIPHLLGELNKLCQKITKEFNEAHMQGWTLNNGATASQTGIKFFVDASPTHDASGVTALNFAINPDILRDANLIAASDKPVGSATAEGNDQRGNNVNALKLVGLITKKDANGNPDNFDSAYRGIIVSIGIEMASIVRQRSTQEVVQSQIINSRKSMSDVSLDEEMTNVVRFGHSYNAAARIITSMDEVLETLINKVGIVGR